MTRSALPLRRAATAVAATALVFAGTLPAAAVPADEDVLYAFQGDYEDNVLVSQRFTVLSQTDATRDPLTATLDLDYSVMGIEVHEGVGYAILSIENDSDPDDYFIATWNPETGEPGTPAPLSWVDGTIVDVWAMDVVVGGELPDGTILTLAVLDAGDGIDEWIVSVDPASGAVTPIVDVSGDLPSFLDSLATDPTTGTTYLFADDDDGMPMAVVVDLEAAVVTDVYELEDIQDTAGAGYMGGADFDADGILWFFYDDDDGPFDLLFHTTGPFGVSVAAQFVGPAVDLRWESLALDGATEEPDEPEEPVDPEEPADPEEPVDPATPAAPTLPATGSDPTVPGLAVLLLVGAGTAAVAAGRVRRRVT